jgi:hypothetical protein
MTNPIDLSLQATHLWLRAASLTWKAATLPLEVSARVAGAMCERALGVRERADGPAPVQVAVPQQPPRREAEAAVLHETDTAPHVGAEIEVVEPWEGYGALSAADVVQRLADVDDTTRAAVRLYESTHQSREAILHATE